MLMPAAVLIVIILGALAVDRAVIFGAQRDLVATAQAAANDAAAGVDVGSLREGGTVRLDAARIDRAVAATVGEADGVVASRWEIEGNVVVVHLERRVELVFTKGVPGASDTQVVRATARSELIRS